MKKVSLVQVNFQQGPASKNAFYLPYSVGCLWSYAYSFPEVQQNFSLDHVLWKRENINEIIDKFADQSIVAFSCYIWNRTYNYALAKEIKKINPSCLIVFGGPELPITDPTIFKKYPYIDVIIKKEGELTFNNMLHSFDCMKNVPGLLINNNGTVINTGESDRINDLSVLPSPYLTGFFDPLVAENSEVEWMATIETNRGCPYQCTFCDWGSLTLSKIKLFPLEKVFGELEWISKNGCGTLDCADANFGIFPDRDNQIVDRFIELQNQYGLPYNWFTAWAKNQRKEVIGIIKKLFKNRKFYNRGLNISLQTATDSVLSIIKRKNMHEVAISELYEMAQKEQIPVFMEMILGLPGESLHSWKENFFNLFRIGIHANLDVTIAQLLENAEMNLVQKQIYSIETAEIYDYLSSSYNNDAWPETIAITTSTADMPHNDMKEAILFTWFITNFHMQFFSNLVSRFLYKHLNVDYAEFYDRLYQAILDDNWMSQQVEHISRGVDLWFKEGSMKHPELSNGIQITSQNFFNALAMQVHLENQYDHLFELIKSVLKTFNVDELLLTDVMALQKNMLVNFHNLDQYPKIHQFHYNLYDFIMFDQPLIKTNQDLKFEFCHEKNGVTIETIERVFYSRKNNFAQTLVTVL